jgi:hypothetical protein
MISPDAMVALPNLKNSCFANVSLRLLDQVLRLRSGADSNSSGGVSGQSEIRSAVERCLAPGDETERRGFLVEMLDLVSEASGTSFSDGNYHDPLEFFAVLLAAWDLWQSPAVHPSTHRITLDSMAIADDDRLPLVVQRVAFPPTMRVTLHKLFLPAFQRLVFPLGVEPAPQLLLVLDRTRGGQSVRLDSEHFAIPCHNDHADYRIEALICRETDRNHFVYYSRHGCRWILLDDDCEPRGFDWNELPHEAIARESYLVLLSR